MPRGVDIPPAAVGVAHGTRRRTSTRAFGPGGPLLDRLLLRLVQLYRATGAGITIAPFSWALARGQILAPLLAAILSAIRLGARLTRLLMGLSRLTRLLRLTGLMGRLRIHRPILVLLHGACDLLSMVGPNHDGPPRGPAGAGPPCGKEQGMCHERCCCKPCSTAARSSRRAASARQVRHLVPGQADHPGIRGVWKGGRPRAFSACSPCVPWPDGPRAAGTTVETAVFRR